MITRIDPHRNPTEATSRPSVVITGTSSGIGQAIAMGLAAKGYRVFAGVRRRPSHTDDVLNGTLEESFRLHVNIARSHGAGEEQIRAGILLVAEFGLAKAWRAPTVRSPP